MIAAEEPALVVVGMPLTLRGDHGEQAHETAAFVERLRGALGLPVETYDERFTSVLAGGDDARAAAHLLSELPPVAERTPLKDERPSRGQIRRRRIVALAACSSRRS